MSNDQGGRLDPVSLENQLIEIWGNEKTFQSSIEARRMRGRPFTFLEGPPTANGKPGIHHVLSRLYKDMVCRWKTMEGYVVERKAGWDTHGLPVEIEVQKRLDLMSNEAIEAYGMKEFNEACKESVWTYEQAWREMTERMGFWVDMNDPYVTLEDDYIESSWWSLKQMHEKGLLFRGHKVLPYCPQTGTSYSSHEVALGYKEVTEPAVFVKFDLIDDPAAVDKLNLSMHSKPSGATSGRITPPSGYSSSRRNNIMDKNGDQMNSGSRKTPGQDGEGTGSVQMSND